VFPGLGGLDPTVISGEIIAVDGKTLRCSYN
jgi:hypothetical protein